MIVMLPIATCYKVGDLVLVKLPHEESGKNQKLSRLWHEPYRVIQRNDPDLTVVKQFFPEAGPIQIHQFRVCPCSELPIGFYWYGGNSHSAGSVPRWVEKLTQCGIQNSVLELDEEQEQSDDDVDSIPEFEGSVCNRDEPQVNLEVDCTCEFDHFDELNNDTREDASTDLNQEQLLDVPRCQLRDRSTRRAPKTSSSSGQTINRGGE